MRPKSGTESRYLDILVQSLDKETSVSVSVESWTTTSHLRFQLAEKIGLSPARQTLFSRCRELGSSERICDLLAPNSRRRTQNSKPRFASSPQTKRARFLSFSDMPAHLKIVMLDSHSLEGQTIFPLLPSEGGLKTLMPAIREGLARGVPLMPIKNGTSGSYFARDKFRNPLAIFKPVDEEAFAPFNPKNLVGVTGSEGIRNGLKAGEGALREVAASLLDSNGIHGVPATELVVLSDQKLARKVEPLHFSNFSTNFKQFGWEKLLLSAMKGTKIGSLQKLVRNVGSSEEFSHTLFPVKDVQKIALLDLRILNRDRNTGNILVSKNPEGFTLTPIDHALAFPEVLEIGKEELCWLEWPQIDQPIVPELKELILNLNPEKDEESLSETLDLSEKALQNFRISEEFLKLAVARGLTIKQIAMYYIQQSEDKPSILQNITHLASTINIKEEQLTPVFTTQRRKSMDEDQERQEPTKTRALSIGVSPEKLELDSLSFWNNFARIAISELESNQAVRI